MNPIPTPLTDAISLMGKFQSGDGKERISEAVPAPFARILERENHLLREVMNKATEFADGFPAHLSHCTCEYCALAKAIKDHQDNEKVSEVAGRTVTKP